MDGFEPVGFALPVVTVDYVQSRSPGDFAAQISEIIYFDKIEDHQEILAYQPDQLPSPVDTNRSAQLVEQAWALYRMLF